MELNSSVNTFLQGMNLDSDISLLKENQYTYAENIRLLANEDSTTGVLQNRDCLKKFESQINGQILGTTVTRVFKDNTSVECIVVITNDNNINNIYLIYIGDEVECNLFVSAKIGWTSKVKIVANYESDTVSKIYVADGINQLKMINLNKTYDSSKLNTDSFDITPSALLTAPRFIKMIKGNLEVGVVQYAYQLFSKHGAESPMSPVSEPIYIPKQTNNGNSLNTVGGNIGDVSNLGCQIEIQIDQTVEFDTIRIYRIHYSKNNDIAQVYIIAETEITDTKMMYQDTQNTFVSSITVDEFNMMVLQSFIPKTIEKHDNRLFASNLKQSNWDVEYDTRAFRCDKNGDILLLHGDINQNISGKLLKDGTINGNIVPEKHDCINPSNQLLFEEDSFKYVYGYNNDKLVFGGTGPNVSYEFCYVQLNLSDSSPKTSNPALKDFTTTSDEITCQDKELINSPIQVLNENGGVLKYITVPSEGVLKNYSDSYFTSKCLGYQRDEIYRFGIVFYNKKHQKTPVHWIGDIRIPCHRMVGTNKNSKIIPFHFNKPLDTNDSSVKLSELVGYAIGVSFNLKNIESLKEQGVVAYEIVRCPRTELDRTIVTQGITSSLVKFNYWGEEKNYMGDADIRPMALFNMGSRYSVQTVWSQGDGNPYHYWNDSPTVEKDIPTTYIEFVSPEILVSQESITDNIKNSKLCRLYWSSSFTTTMSDHYITEDNTSQQYTQHYYNWAIPQKNVHTLIPDKPLELSNPSCGSFKLSDDPRDGFDQDLYLLYFNHFINDSDNRGRCGNALIQKYYDSIYDDSSIAVENHNIDDAIVSQILPFIHSDEESKNYAQTIGDRLYVNTTVGAKYMLSNHGKNAILKMSDTFNNVYSFFDSFTPDITTHGQMNTAAIVNIKQYGTMYGGEWYINRINSTYIPCGAHVDINENDNICVFGGDTYLGVLDYAHTTMRQSENDPEKNKDRELFINCYIPLESTINLNLFDGTFSKTIVDNVGQNLIQYEPTVTQNYVQSKPLYEYNSAYSTDANAQLFVPELLYTDENPIFETRITCSELKTNNEIIDSWTKFKFANYLDVDNQYGPITNLKSFNGKLFFWQDSAVGVASVNERSLIQDNNIAQLTLGTGGILVRYDYHTTLNGSARVNDKSICNSASTLYWYDTDKHEICAINNTVIELSKVKGVKSWCNKLLGRSETLGWYDWKYNEVLFQNKSEGVKRSIVFNEQLNTFTGFYTYPASHVAQMVDKLVTLDDIGNIYTHDSDVNYEPFESKITYVINKGYPETKVFDNVWFDAELSTDETLKSIVFKTKTQETNPVTFEGIENREDTYRFPIPRDKNGVARMRGKYLICDYTFDCTNDGDFKIPYIKTTFRISRV